jgi:Flp pilus assembly protein protease CpaA
MPLEIIDILFLPMIFFIGIVTSWEDFNIGKVRNKWIALGLIYFAIISALLLVFSLFASELTAYIKLIDSNLLRQAMEIPLNYFGKVVLNGFLALGLGFLLWKYNFIAAGDAKLFFLFSLLLPLKYYWKAYMPYFPSFTLLLNIILPVFFLIFLQASWYLARKLLRFFKGELVIRKEKVIGTLKKESGGLIKMFIGFSAVFLLMAKLRDFFIPWLTDYFPGEGLLLIVLFLLYRPLYSALKKDKALFIIIFIIFIFYISSGLINAPQTTLIELKGMLKIVALFLLVIGLIRKLMDYYIKNQTYKKINADNLKPGMRLAESNHPDIGRILTGGLNKHQVKIIKEWTKKNNFKQIGIYPKTPFAIWMFLGVIITIILKKSLIITIIDIVKTYF